DHFRQTAIVQMNSRRNQNICSSKLNDIVETGIVSNFINRFRFDIKKNKAQHAIVCRDEIMSVGLINNTFSVFMVKTVHRNNMNAAFWEMMIGILYDISRLFQVVSLYFMADVQNGDVRIQRDYPAFHRSYAVVGISEIGSQGNHRHGNCFKEMQI